MQADWKREKAETNSVQFFDDETDQTACSTIQIQKSQFGYSNLTEKSFCFLVVLWWNREMEVHQFFSFLLFASSLLLQTNPTWKTAVHTNFSPVNFFSNKPPTKPPAREVNGHLESIDCRKRLSPTFLEKEFLRPSLVWKDFLSPRFSPPFSFTIPLCPLPWGPCHPWSRRFPSWRRGRPFRGFSGDGRTLRRPTQKECTFLHWREEFFF